jgi:hypothetical protein
LLAWALAADGVRVGTLHLGSWGGVFRSLYGGLAWRPFSDAVTHAAS